MPGNIDYIALADKAAEQLQGTAKGFAELGPEFEQAQNNQIFCNHLDQLVFECEICNWWCEISEMSEKQEWVCDECENEI